MTIWLSPSWDKGHMEEDALVSLEEELHIAMAYILVWRRAIVLLVLVSKFKLCSFVLFAIIFIHHTTIWSCLFILFVKLSVA